MKRVVNFDAENIDVTEVTDSSNVGIKWNNGSKNIVIKKNYEEFAAMCLKDLSVAYSWTKPTKREFVKKALRQNPEVFVFDDKKQLITWLLKED
jgi:hypothetical protein